MREKLWISAVALLMLACGPKREDYCAAAVSLKDEVVKANREIIEMRNDLKRIAYRKDTEAVQERQLLLIGIDETMRLRDFRLEQAQESEAKCRATPTPQPAR